LKEIEEELRRLNKEILSLKLLLSDGHGVSKSIGEDEVNTCTIEDYSSIDMRDDFVLQLRYDALTQQNEVLRAQLGSYGLATESTPEEDMDMNNLYAKWESAKKRKCLLDKKNASFSQ